MHVFTLVFLDEDGNPCHFSFVAQEEDIKNESVRQIVLHVAGKMRIVDIGEFGEAIAEHLDMRFKSCIVRRL